MSKTIEIEVSDEEHARFVRQVNKSHYKRSGYAYKLFIGALEESEAADKPDPALEAAGK